MTVEEKIHQLEQNLVIDLNMAEQYSFTQYIPYIKQNYLELSALKTAQYLREKHKDDMNNFLKR